ncbi:bidirectional sugar transporter SWEET1-like [Hevea brasiliensis]|uniref:bidirectional sugar transporter SWEET1-like n=1 Tax=Hevea brasiliensis TaxID=3981 RepID=UPI0025D2CD32|nr:bidirectional sugar transporter SWEET1-like [Hevea brasiliensis]
MLVSSQHVEKEFRYGLPFISKGNILLSIINHIGALLEIIYLSIFIYYSPNASRHRIFKFLSSIPCVFVPMFIGSLVMHGEHRRIFCGYVIAITSPVVYCITCGAATWMMIQMHSVGSVSLFGSLMNTLCRCAWLAYGISRADLFIAIPNGIGGGTYLLRTILYFIYRGQQAENAPVRDQFIEIEIPNQDDGEEEILELEEEIPELEEEIPDEEIPELEEEIPEEEIPELVEIQVMGDDKKHLVFEMIWEELYRMIWEDFETISGKLKEVQATRDDLSRELVT